MTSIKLQSILVLALMILPSNAHSASVVSWEASSGLTPDLAVSTLNLVNTADTEVPFVSNGVLNLQTSSPSENVFYIDTSLDIDPNEPFYIEAIVKYKSGSSSSSARAPIAIGFTHSVGVGNLLFIGEDEVFFLNSSSTAGTVAQVDTDDAFHTYRINFVNEQLELFYDDTLILTGSTFNDVGGNGSVDRVLFGEITGFSQGESEWQSLEYGVPEPSSLALLSLGGLILSRRRR